MQVNQPDWCSQTLNPETAERKPGRPHAIPAALIPVILSMYDGGLGYRGITRELEKRDVFVDWTTVRRAIKASRLSLAGKK